MRTLYRPSREAADLRELNRATLARQLLLERVPLDVPTAVHRLGALQAPAPARPVRRARRAARGLRAGGSEPRSARPDRRPRDADARDAPPRHRRGLSARRGRNGAVLQPAARAVPSRGGRHGARRRARLPRDRAALAEPLEATALRPILAELEARDGRRPRLAPRAHERADPSRPRRRGARLRAAQPLRRGGGLARRAARRRRPTATTRLVRRYARLLRAVQPRRSRGVHRPRRRYASHRRSRLSSRSWSG